MNQRNRWFETQILGRRSMPTASPENQGRRMGVKRPSLAIMSNLSRQHKLKNLQTESGINIFKRKSKRFCAVKTIVWESILLPGMTVKIFIPTKEKPSNQYILYFVNTYQTRNYYLHAQRKSRRPPPQAEIYNTTIEYLKTIGIQEILNLL